MKKKTTHPLTLNRETLRQLEIEQLGHRVGGGDVVLSDRMENYGVGFCATGPRSGTC